MFLFRFVFKLIKYIFVFLLILLILPITLLGFMYKNEAPKIENYQEIQSIEESVAISLDDFLKSTTQDKLVVGVEGDNINATIKEMFIKMSAENPTFNPNYLNPDVEEKDSKYAAKLANNMVGFKGAWLEYNQDTIILKTSADIELASFLVYKTSLRVEITVIEENDIITLTVKKISIGNLSANWIYNLARTGLIKLQNIDLSQMINEKLPVGHFDAEKRVLTVSRQELYSFLETAGNDDQNMAMLMELIRTIDILNIHIGESKMGLEIALGKLKAMLELNEDIRHLETQEEVFQVIKGQLASILISALSPDADEYVNLDIREKELNEILNYYLNQETLLEKDLPLGSKNFKLTMKPILTKLETGVMKLSIRFELANQEDDNFIAEIVVNVLPKPSTQNPADLIFEVTSIDIGETNIQTTSELWINLQQILKDALTSDKIVVEENEIILKDFMSEFVQTGTTVEEILVLNGKLRFKIKPENQATLNEIKNEIKDILDIINNDANNEFDIDTTAPVEDILDYVNELDETQKEELYETIANELQDKGIDLSDILAALGQTP
ncbi:MAG: hypothetical protein GX312_00675 [Candidatus Phytoplasma sp.]|nr:hypothetical protein [Phytoplasma sp.]